MSSAYNNYNSVIFVLSISVFILILNNIQRIEAQSNELSNNALSAFVTNSDGSRTYNFGGIGGFQKSITLNQQFSERIAGIRNNIGQILRGFVSTNNAGTPYLSANSSIQIQGGILSTLLNLKLNKIRRILSAFNNGGGSTSSATGNNYIVAGGGVGVFGTRASPPSASRTTRRTAATTTTTRPRPITRSNRLPSLGTTFLGFADTFDDQEEDEFDKLYEPDDTSSITTFMKTLDFDDNSNNVVPTNRIKNVGSNSPQQNNQILKASIATSSSGRSKSNSNLGGRTERSRTNPSSKSTYSYPSYSPGLLGLLRQISTGPPSPYSLAQ